MFMQYYYETFFIQISIPPEVIQRRSFLSFFILTFLSYFLLYRAYIFKRINTKYKISVAVFCFAISTWAQFMSVQYLGVGYFSAKTNHVVKSPDDNPNVSMICEYYSFFELRKQEFIPLFECYNEADKLKKIESLSWYLETTSTFFNCHKQNEYNFILRFFSNKYNLGTTKSMYVIDGIGPFFNLNIDQINHHH